MFGVESVLYLNRYILDTNGIDGRRIDNLGTEVTQFHGLNVREFVDGISRLDNLRVSCHKAIHVGPDLQYLCVQHGSNDGCRIVRTATSQVGCLVAVAVTGYEARNHVDVLVTDVLESLLHQFGRQVGINHMFALFVPSTDKVSRVHADAILHHGCHDVR